jgi:hypothetical protein
MQTIKYVHWHENNSWLGYIEEYPDYWTQGDTLADLVEHLKDLYLDLSGDLSRGTLSVCCWIARHQNLRPSHRR